MENGDLRTRVFIEHPTLFFPAVATVLAIPALGPTPSFGPLVLLLSSLLIHSKIVAHRPAFTRNVTIMWIGLSVGAAIGRFASSMPAVASPVAAGLSTVILEAVSSVFALIFVYLDLYSSRVRTPWARLTFFPALWATAWQLIAHFSPLGYLATWTPTEGIDPYVWMRPYVGPWGFNWLVGAFAVIATDVVGSWFIGADSAETTLEAPHEHRSWFIGAGSSANTSESPHERGEAEDLLIPVDLPATTVVNNTRIRRGSRHIIFLFTIVLLLAIPSYFVRPIPLPSRSDSSTTLVTGCILPAPDESGIPPTFDDFLHATRTHVDDARVDLLLWPEGAVYFENAKDRKEKLERVQNATQGSFVAVAFEEPAPNDNNVQRPGTRRNGLAIVGPKGVVFEYYKRHLVPFVESFPLSKSTDTPTIYEVQLPISNRGRQTRAVPITASICLDFAFPDVLSALPSRPALVLAPAKTWHRDVSLAMWEQARARAEETGSMVLFCDGGVGGVSGVAGHGMREVFQAGSGAWTRAVGIDNPFDESKTAYAAGGDWAMTALVWGILGLGWGGEVGFLWLGRLAARGNRTRARQILAQIWERMRRVGPGQGQGEQQPLLA